MTTGACITQPLASPVNIQVSKDVNTAHAEPMFASNPTNPLNIVGGAKLFPTLNRAVFQEGYFYSFDGGCTWRNGGPLPGYDLGNGHQLGSSNISVAFGPHNDVHTVVVYHHGITVSTSTNGGNTFGQPVAVAPPMTSGVISDKPWIAVDHFADSHHGTIYVAWSDITCLSEQSCGNELGFARSTDGGQTFSSVQDIEGSAPFCDQPHHSRHAAPDRCDAIAGAQLAITPDGSIVAAYLYLGDNTTTTAPLVVSVSHDGGISWSAPVMAAMAHLLPDFFPGTNYNISSLPSLACDPQTGQLYLAWADAARDDADVLLTTSHDGQRWATPLRVNDDPPSDNAHQFAPQVTVAPHGTVSITFYDSRRDPTGKLIDLFLAQSTTRGATFLANRRVSAQNWDPSVGAPTQANGDEFLGDYQGLTADDYFVHPFWTDAHTGYQQILTAAIQSA